MYAVEAKEISKEFAIDIAPRTLLGLCRKTLAPNRFTRKITVLEDINFSVEQGETIGIIGDNGSGKTTLLRIIAGIYRQTKGTVVVQGKTTAFLQGPVGIERNLNALENIAILGAIIGLDRGEIKECLDDIVAFAELQDFLYMPLRDYSSGMIQRLLMSISRFASAEILLVDEMLAFGNQEFRKKCYGVFESHRKTGKTCILTSHNRDIIERFCSKALLLEKGRQAAFGVTGQVLALYDGIK